MQWKLPGVWSVVAVAGLTFFLGLGSGKLFDEDEPKNAECGREMFERGDWVTTTLGGSNWFEKPALLYWLQITFYNIRISKNFSGQFNL